MLKEVHIQCLTMNLLVLGMLIPGLFSHVDPRILCSLAAVLTSLAYVASSLANTFPVFVATYALIGATNHFMSLTILLVKTKKSSKSLASVCGTEAFHE